MSSKLGHRLRCQNCSIVVGVLDEEEKKAWLGGEFSSVLCFDCDSESAVTTPSIFWQWREGELFDIGDMGFQIRDGKLCVIGRARARTHERTRTRVLSSYTYLNRNSHNREILGTGLEIKVCPACDGKGMLSEFGEDFACASCDGVGAMESAIILPSWIIGLGCEHV